MIGFCFDRIGKSVVLVLLGIPFAPSQLFANPPVFETQVTNVVQTEVTNSVPFDRLRSFAINASSSTPDGLVASAGLLPGLLHGLTLSVSTPAGSGQECIARAELRLERDGAVTTKRIAIVEAIDGNNSVSLDLTRPIKLEFDEAVDSARLLVNLQSDITSDFCHTTTSVVYEDFQ